MTIPTSGVATEAEVLAWTKTLSNWGRWGDDDSLGTLNFIDEEVRLNALASIRSGDLVACGLPIAMTPRHDTNASRYMIATGEGLHEPDPDRHVHAATDSIAMQVHGHQFTHLDALSHWIWDARLYNDRPATAITAERGATHLSVADARSGIVTRGILLDVANARGVDALDPGEPVTPADLERAEQVQGLRCRRGDALLLHTGHGVHLRDASGTAPTSWSGWDAACLPWLHEREIAMIGAEASNEVMPNDYVALGRHPIHSVGIVAMGLWLIDNCDLGVLAERCRARGAWDFLLLAAPLALRGATGSPLNPIAVL